MPPLAVIEASVGTCPVSPSVFEEIAREEPGQQILLDRTMDLMLITALRAWFTRPGAEIPTWHRAHSDPVVAPALRLLHADPAHPWTLPAPGAKTGASRARLARGFNARAGQPPMTYLRQRCLALAADLVRETDTTLAAVADRVGFANALALINAL
ncbi:helix-turn-helix domain-containing protein [Streptomyces massasporeus]|uniref:helix-turn-helix domain-containing protein n=1 Tax=Streptomyces massasporeus TaxID=67324 RepID=UPI0036E2EC38